MDPEYPPTELPGLLGRIDLRSRWFLYAYAAGHQTAAGFGHCTPRGVHRTPPQGGRRFKAPAKLSRAANTSVHTNLRRPTHFP